VKRFGVGRFGQPFIEHLAAAIDGTSQAPTQPVIDQTQIQAMIRQQFEEQRRASQKEQALSVLQQFEATSPDFLDDVRDDMAIALSLWERQHPGHQVTVEVFKQAYDKACLLNPDISAIIKQREAAKAAGTAQASIQKAKAAGSSIKSSTGGAPNGSQPKDDSWRSHLEAAMGRE
jgi:hypothetical protein